MEEFLFSVLYFQECGYEVYPFEGPGQSGVHSFDWMIKYQEVDRNTFCIDITSCGFIAYAKKYDAEGMLPGICQVDYMISHYMNVGFDRTQTLGAGGSCCDGRYCMNGYCEFDIEKRLAERKQECYVYQRIWKSGFSENYSACADDGFRGKYISADEPVF
ncbi:MAG: L-2-amino-thiazoline-4-carboxylic acid hydrolase [Clostridia bacterium]|nr:L-2-amino-thiazoline-4-carboxylic acid hydrolase [Clostridia bacterium]